MKKRTKKQIEKRRKVKSIVIGILLGLLWCFVFLSLLYGGLSISLAIFKLLDFSFIGNFSTLGIFFTLLGMFIIVIYVPLRYALRVSNRLINFLKGILE